ncbi:hypothetical protein SETIT_8G239200v2 [Setaria italica]|uniref:Uncharacterized protein n=1 Tax=Setaria italica TaxID=4555 RepID=A0A368SCS1_SETIT|nr:hypothetical protein SETIT_8G239200v2 [Setaria italica]
MITGFRGRTSNLSWRACRLGICVFRNSRSSCTSMQSLISKEQTLHKSCLTHCGTFTCLRSILSSGTCRGSYLQLKGSANTMDRAPLQFAPEEEITQSELTASSPNFNILGERGSPKCTFMEFSTSQGSSLTLQSLMSRVLKCCSFLISLGNSLTPVPLKLRYLSQISPHISTR